MRDAESFDEVAAVGFAGDQSLLVSRTFLTRHIEDQPLYEATYCVRIGDVVTDLYDQGWGSAPSPRAALETPTDRAVLRLSRRRGWRDEVMAMLTDSPCITVQAESRRRHDTVTGPPRGGNTPLFTAARAPPARRESAPSNNAAHCIGRPPYSFHRPTTTSWQFESEERWSPFEDP